MMIVLLSRQRQLTYRLISLGKLRLIRLPFVNALTDQAEFELNAHMNLSISRTAAAHSHELLM